MSVINDRLVRVHKILLSKDVPDVLTFSQVRQIIVKGADVRNPITVKSYIGYLLEDGFIVDEGFNKFRKVKL